MTSPVTTFSIGPVGDWDIVSAKTVIGPQTGAQGRLSAGPDPAPGAAMILRGAASNTRYATRREVADLRAVQEGLGRPHATCAALIPISKSDSWWALAQDERRSIFEEQSKHHSIGIGYLPQIARKLFHGRDLGEPFDFLTWFEFAPEHEALFDKLVSALRSSHEWTFVTREVDIRLVRTRPIAPAE